jgi:competence ComEA-like helix-hairpin-helix protein
MYRLPLALLLVPLLIRWPLVASAAQEKSLTTTKVAVLIDTDVGERSDDVLAMALAVCSPELDVRGITTVQGDCHTRALLVCRLLHAIGRHDVPVCAGRPELATPDFRGPLQYGLRPSLRLQPQRGLAAEFLYQQLRARPGELTLVALGPLTNLAALLSRHPDCKPWIKRIVLVGGAIRRGYDERSPVVAEWNIRTDTVAAQTVFRSGVPLLLVPLDAAISLKVEADVRRRIFHAITPLARELRALEELSDQSTPTLADALAIALCFDEHFCQLEDLRLVVDNEGYTRPADGMPNARVATSVRRDEFLKWFVKRLTPAPATPVEAKKNGKSSQLSRLIAINQAGVAELQRLPGIGPVLAERILAERRKAPFRAVDDLRRVRGIGAKTLERLVPFITVENQPINLAARIPRGALPNLVHVIEDFETDIERRWWLCGQLETENVPPESRRACRGVLTNDFDDRMGDPQAQYKAVIFNPVPGPPMGKNPRLAFRCWLKGTDMLRVQLFSLTRGYHRHLVLSELPRESWQEIAVDMTQARRPDGSGGPLAENERIDDIQFYVDAAAELLIDDIVLYDAAPAEEKRLFPKRLLFTGCFDTGRQGKEWPGNFEIVSKTAPQTGRAARSVTDLASGNPVIRLHLRGQRPVSGTTQLRFRYQLTAAVGMRIVPFNGAEPMGRGTSLTGLTQGTWTEAMVDLGAAGLQTGDRVDALHFLLPRGAELGLDDVLLFEPEANPG